MASIKIFVNKNNIEQRPLLRFSPSASNSFDWPVNQRFRDRGNLISSLNDRKLNPDKVAVYESALTALAGELARAKENERQRIAEQLHDEFGQDLLLAKMKLSQLSDKLSPKYGGCVEEISGIVSGLIGYTRALIHELSTQHQCETGIRAALQSLAEEFQVKHGLVCTAKLDLLPALLKDEAHEVFLRAVRELLFNVVKHARASRVKIVATRKPGSVAIEVSDDGRGFDPQKPALSDLSLGRFGLFSVRARLATIGGDLRIVSRVGSGTRAIITLPIDAAE